MYEPVVSTVKAGGRYSGALRLGTPEQLLKAEGGLTAAKLDKAICAALNTGNLPDDERIRLGELLLSAGGQ